MSQIDRVNHSVTALLSSARGTVRHRMTDLALTLAVVSTMPGCEANSTDPEPGFRDQPQLIDVESNTCPPDLIHAGSAPGIICDNPGETCADDSHYCECGEQTFEGAPWHCVPTQAECPEQLPLTGDSCDAEASCDFFDNFVRMRCECESDAWTCKDVTEDCPIFGMRTGMACDAPESQLCRQFQPSKGGRPAVDISCRCAAGRWECADGCPLEFPGDGAACDTTGPTNCSWAQDEGWTSCGCNGEWNCTHRD